MNSVIKNSRIAARRYLQLLGYEEIGEANGFLVCQVEDGLVFVNVCGRIKGDEFPESDTDSLRWEFEKAFLEWMTEHPDEADFHVSCDEVSVNIIREDRALVRHYQNAIQP